jgi:hypothetical protein
MSIGGILSIYAATHSGFGPGGFVGDENDTGPAILTFLPLPLAIVTECRNPPNSRAMLLAIAFLNLIGTISTDSRGDFVGLLCVLAYFFIRSRRKVLILFLCALMSLCVLPFLPSDYISEMQSIKDTSSGTAAIRRHYWKIAWRVFSDPRNTLFGVGLGNAPFRLGDYETGDDLERFPSSGGRAVHSIYFEILPDLGVWGIVIVGTLLGSSLKQNFRNIKKLERASKNVLADKLRSPPIKIQPSPVTDSLSDGQIQIIRGEIEYVKALLSANTLSFVAIFTAGAFISVLYYPMFWLFVGLSAALNRYVGRLLETLNFYPVEKM